MSQVPQQVFDDVSRLIGHRAENDPRKAEPVPVGDLKPKRLHARKIRKPLGPFQTVCTARDKGKDRQIELVKLTPHGLVYRLKGLSNEFTVGHEVCFARAVSIAAGFNAGPRDTTRITRGEANIRT